MLSLLQMKLRTILSRVTFSGIYLFESFFFSLLLAFRNFFKNSFFFIFLNTFFQILMLSFIFFVYISLFIHSLPILLIKIPLRSVKELKKGLKNTKLRYTQSNYVAFTLFALKKIFILITYILHLVFSNQDLGILFLIKKIAFLHFFFIFISFSRFISFFLEFKLFFNIFITFYLSFENINRTL